MCHWHGLEIDLLDVRNVGISALRCRLRDCRRFLKLSIWVRAQVKATNSEQAGFFEIFLWLLADDVEGLFVGAEPEEDGMPHLGLTRPLGEFYLAHELGISHVVAFSSFTF